MTESKARQRVLDNAEQLFVERGYNAVTIKDIAKATGIHHASLYHHFPDGKEAIYMEVMHRYLNRHRAGIGNAIKAGGNELRAQLQHVANWLLSQPPLDMIRMTNSDFAAIEDAAARQLSDMAYQAIFIPLEEILYQAHKRGEVDIRNPGNVAGAIVSSIEGLHAVQDEWLYQSREHMAAELIDVFLHGMRRRNAD